MLFGLVLTFPIIIIIIIIIKIIIIQLLLFCLEKGK